jgi:glutamate N-acetyltransferase / amino-acid N-acetyltransferase
MTKKSPLAPARFPNLLPVAGVRLGATAAGIRYEGRDDVMLAEFPEGTTVGGVFTKSKTASAPVEWCQSALKNGCARGLVVNSGNSLAFTGREGRKTVKEAAAKAAKLIGCRQKDVFTASTGVIGEPFPASRLVNALPKLHKSLTGGDWKQSAEAIRTTDTFPKGAVRIARIDGNQYVINGIAKGSGMIAPDMATMLAFLFTNAAIPADILQAIVADAAAKSFNCITVDSDTSTSDTVLMFATGQGPAHRPFRRIGDPRLRDFREKLKEVMLDLAHQIVRDGEGASKFISVTVTGAASAKAARRIGLSIANSPLVKTAVAGEDPNWGRIVMAVGKAGEKANRDKLRILFGGQLVASKGGVDLAYDEAQAAQYMKGQEIDISVDVGVGKGKATVWTCDLTHGYVTINADYRS